MFDFDFILLAVFFFVSINCDCNQNAWKDFQTCFTNGTEMEKAKIDNCFKTANCNISISNENNIHEHFGKHNHENGTEAVNFTIAKQCFQQFQTDAKTTLESCTAEQFPNFILPSFLDYYHGKPKGEKHHHDDENDAKCDKKVLKTCIRESTSKCNVTKQCFKNSLNDCDLDKTVNIMCNCVKNVDRIIALEKFKACIGSGANTNFLNKAYLEIMNTMDRAEHRYCNTWNDDLCAEEKGKGKGKGKGKSKESKEKNGSKENSRSKESKENGKGKGKDGNSHRGEEKPAKNEN